MTIREAIKKAKKEYEWFKSENPVTVLVGFEDREGEEQQTTFDLITEDEETELEDIWDYMFAEMESEIDGVTYVEMHEWGYMS